MKLVEAADDQKTVRLGIVKLGTAVGKMKYALIDETDIPVIHEYKFDARLEIDRDGDGLQVIAMGHPKSQQSPTPIPLQNILWEHRNGPVEEGYNVCHLNGITMDNRMDNLTLIPSWLSKEEQKSILAFRCTEAHAWSDRDRHTTAPNRQLSQPQSVEDDGGGSESESNSSNDELPLDLAHGSGRTNSLPTTEEKRGKRQGENSLYWKAITQLLANETDEQKNASSAPYSRAYYTTEGELISRDCPSFYFFECHYPPCTAVEPSPREFAMCGRCQQARYCGRECQRDDWTIHRDNCSEAHRRGSHSSSSSRSSRSSRRGIFKGEADR